MRKRSRLVPVLAAATQLLAVAANAGPFFTNIYIFSPDAFDSGTNPQATNSDGVGPNGLVLSGSILFGTAAAGGSAGLGTIFRVNTDGSNFTNLLSFYDGPYEAATSTYPESIGDTPSPGLILISNTLYGTTFYGGTHFAGTVFKINTDGTGFSVLHAFDYTDGANPANGLIRNGNALYGTTVGGGINQDGTIFSIQLSNLSFSKLYDFEEQIDPYGGLAITNGILYGFGYYGGASNHGLIYTLGLDGGGYEDLFDFDGTNGWAPYGSPTLAGSTLYGVTYQGGTNGGGNIFSIGIDGLDFTNLFDFQAQSGANTTGAYPYGYTGLVLAGNRLYGTTSTSGTGGQGTIFQINPNGTGFTVLHSFQYTDGGNPDALLLAGGTLYGASGAGIQGISLGVGGIFELTLQPALRITRLDNTIVLTWDDPSYFLYQADSLGSAFTKIAGSSSPYTNTVSGPEQFFQLRSE